MKIYLQYPWVNPDTSYYKYLMHGLPSNIDFVNFREEDFGKISKKEKMFMNQKVKRIIRKTTRGLKLPIPNAHFSITRENYDLIHCAHCLSLNKTPWVADFESVWQLSVSLKPTKLEKKILDKSNCKKILPWTKSIKKQFMNFYPKIKDKMEVVYPAVPFYGGHKKQGKTTIIYVSRNFRIKGGLLALETLRRLKEKYRINTIVVSNVPEKLKRKYKEIDIKKLMPQEELFSHLRKSDIFLYPSFAESFGFSLLEAMSFGLPIVTINTDNIESNRREIVEDEEVGFIFDVKGKISYNKIGSKEEKIVRKLVKKTSYLIEDERTRRKMSRRGMKEIKSGKFSIKKRNKKLERIYKNALK